MCVFRFLKTTGAQQRADDTGRLTENRGLGHQHCRAAGRYRCGSLSYASPLSVCLGKPHLLGVEQRLGEAPGGGCVCSVRCLGPTGDLSGGHLPSVAGGQWGGAAPEIPRVRVGKFLQDFPFSFGGRRRFLRPVPPGLYPACCQEENPACEGSGRFRRICRGTSTCGTLAVPRSGLGHCGRNTFVSVGSWDTALGFGGCDVNK